MSPAAGLSNIFTCQRGGLYQSTIKVCKTLFSKIALEMAVCSPDFATQEYETTYFQDHRRESPHIEFEVCIYNTEVYTV